MIGPTPPRARALAWVGLFLGLLTPTGAGAADAADPYEDPSWKVVVSPYLWATGIDGTVSAGGVSADVDVGFDDIVERLSLGAMGAVEVRYGRFIAAVDLFGAVLQDELDSGPAVRTVGPFSFTPSGGAPIVNVPATDVTVGPLDLETRLTQIVVDGKLAYRLLDLPWLDLLAGGPGDRGQERDPRRMIFDFAIGARYWYVRSELEVELGPISVPGFMVEPEVPAFPNLDLPGIEVPGVTFGGLDEKISESDDWVDLLVGGRIGFGLTKRIDLVLIGDVGGFDIGSASHRTWMAMANVGYRWNDRWTFRAGYKALATERGPVDLIIHGLLLGVSRHF